MYKSLLIISSLLFGSNICRAQQWKPQYKTVSRDTVHIRGVVYDAAGKPASSIVLYSRSILTDTQFTLTTITSDQGKFELNGAYFNDTLSVHLLRPQKDIQIITNGSRYIEIHLPTGYNNTIKEPVEITAKRTQPKPPLAKFKVITNNEAFICSVEGPAEFPGGTDKFINYIKQKISYPQKAVDHNVEGEVEIGFIIERDGSLTNAWVIRGIGYGCDEEVIKAVTKSPKWKSAILSGRPMKTQSSVIINFKLTGN